MYYHHSCRYSNTPPAICIRYNITKSDAQECDSDEPHSIEQVCMFFVVEPKLF